MSTEAVLREVESLRLRVQELESKVEQLELEQARQRRAVEELNAILA